MSSNLELEIGDALRQRLGLIAVPPPLPKQSFFQKYKAACIACGIVALLGVLGAFKDERRPATSSYQAKCSTWQHTIKLPSHGGHITMEELEALNGKAAVDAYSREMNAKVRDPQWRDCMLRWADELDRELQ